MSVRSDVWMCKAGVELAIEKAGGVKKLADLVGVRIDAVSQWRRRGKIGVRTLRDVARKTGLPPWTLRPDLYPKPDEDDII